ncbi:MAG: hypothetical protein FJX29_03930 [Alphaproteobacteria bacterium]|nr:hypothetical protein [Alphaproteobacteria bacterium]
MRICILEIFQQLPPESSRAPDRDEAAIADALLNAFFVNVYGVLDNIANIWVCEKSLRGRNGKEIPRTRIGLGKRFEEVFCQLSTDMRKLVLHHEHWLAYIEEFRHATAHRIPPYVPPFSLDPDKMDEWHKLNSELLSAKAFEKADVCEALEKKLAHLKDFFPIIAHTSDPVNFRQLHPQIISDFLAAAEFTDQLIIDLKAP